MLSDLLYRLRALFRRESMDRELDEELRLHHERHVQKCLDEGLSHEEALRQARLEFGGLDQLKEECQDARGVSALDGFTQDLRSALKNLRRTPAFTAFAIVSLALGIGANTAIFSVIDAVLLTPLPYDEPGRLMIVWTVPPKHPEGRDFVSVGPYALIEQASHSGESRSFESAGAVDKVFFPITLAPGHRLPAERVEGHRASASVFRTLGVQPELGRWYTDAEDRPGAAPVAVLGHDLWKRRFQSDPNILGRKLRMDGVDTTVIGVMPAGFGLGEPVDPDFFIPLALNVPLRRGAAVHWLLMVARLRPGVPMEQAQRELETRVAAFAGSHPNGDKDWGIRLQPFRDAARAPAGPSLLVLQGAVGFVLLIACSNVAGLYLARASSRQRELAIRTALGGGRWRIARTALTESLLLSLCGGIAGVLLAYAGLRPLIAISPEPLAHLQSARIGLRVLGFTAALSVATGLLFGIVPALSMSRRRAADALRDGGPNGGGPARHRMRGALVTVEIALSLVLLIGAGLTMKSFLRLQDVAYGCDPSGLLTFQVRVPKAQYVKFVNDPGKSEGLELVDINSAGALFFDNVFAHLSGLPRVESAAGIAYFPPLAGFLTRVVKAEAKSEPTTFYPVTPNYFATMKIPVLHGRDFGAQDNAGSPWVAIVDQTLARTLWPGGDAIGKRLTITNAGSGEQPREVIGVVGDVRLSRRDRVLRPAMYIPHEQQLIHTEGMYADFRILMTFVLRVSGDPMRVAPTVRGAVAEVDRSQPVFNIRTEETILDTELQPSRFNMMLLTLFGGVAVTLAGVGIYGLTAYSVAQRTREIGIRMTLGATTGTVLRMVVKQGAWLVSVGLLLGIGGSLALTGLIRNQLWEVTPTDPKIYISISFLLVLVALAACVIPSRRATRVDPVAALRHE